MRERGALSALPAPHYLHVWWARRPLTLARAAVLTSLLPADSDPALVRRLLGIDGEPAAAQRQLAAARAAGRRVPNPFRGPRAFELTPATGEDARALAALLEARWGG